MKKILISILVIIILVISSARDELVIPNLSVTSTNQEAEVSECGYRFIYQTGWFEKSAVIADCIGPDEVAKMLEALQVEAGSTLRIDFDQVVDRYVALNWNEGIEVEVKDGLVVPDEAGMYIYLITAYFGESEASYVIKIEVNNHAQVREQAYDWLDETSKSSITDWTSAKVEEVKYKEAGIDKMKYQVTFHTMDDDLLGPINVYLDFQTLELLGSDIRN